MRKKSITILSILVLLVGITSLAYFSFKYKTKADTITYDDTGPHPLPYMANWTSHVHPMLLLAQRGHAVVPTLPSLVGPNFGEYSVKDMVAIKNMGLPIDMLGDQWEDDLRLNEYLNIDRDPATDKFTGANVMESASPNNIYLDNTFKTYLKWGKYYAGALDPFGPPAQVDLWRGLGRHYSSLPAMQFMQSVYPDPPKVRLTENNEARKMGGYQMQTDSKRFNQLYPDLSQYIPTDASYDWKRLFFGNRVAGDGWIERYNALFQAWRDNTVNPIWKEIKFTAYWGILQGSFRSYSYGNYASGTSTMTNYEEGPLPDTKGTVPRTSYYPFAWDGATPHIILTSTGDTKLRGLNFDAMNYLFMIEEGKKANPDYEFEMTPWDENSSAITPERYAGAMQYQFWLLRPRALREFRAAAPWDTYLDKFLALTKVVDRVHKQSILTDFWQNGELVENPVGRHPYQANEGQAVMDGFTDEQIRERFGVGRWFHLYSNFDQPYLTNNGGFPVFYLYDTSTNPEIKVSSIAMVKGSEPNREWLMYTYSPLANRTGVEVTLPGFGQVLNLNSTIGGNFYHIKESDRSVTEIMDDPATLTHLLLNHENPIVAPGKQIQFTISGGKDQYDADVAVGLITWAATGGTIDVNGLFTAGSVPGKYKLTATSGAVSESFDLEVGNLMAYWKFDEGEDAYAADSSGRNNGCYMTENWNNNGKFGNSITTTAGIDCDIDEYTAAPPEFTLSSWINVTQGGGGYIGGVFSDDLKKGYYLRFDHNASTKITNVAFMGVWVNIPLVEGKWHHIAVDFKAGQSAHIYFDGQLIKAITENLPTDFTQGFSSFRMGKAFNGSIDQVRLYNQALSDAEILNLYNENPSSNPNITLTKSVSKTDAQPGELVDYTITYQNNGAQDATNAVITDILPANLTLVSAPGAEVNGQTLKWRIPTILAGSSSQSLEIQCRINN